METVKRPTIRDVAALAGVSKSLVSLVYANPAAVSDERRVRVLAAGDELGYRPNLVARSLAGTNGNFVAILVADLHNPLFAEIVEAARGELARAGEISLMTSAVLTPREGAPELDKRLLGLFHDLRPRGILVVGSVPDMAEVGRFSPGCPIVVASAIPDGLPQAPSVRGDDVEGMRLLVDHLTSLGHRRIAHIGGAGGAVARAREEAFVAAMKARGLGGELQLASADYSEAAGGRATAELLRLSEPPTAITAVNDLAAIGAMGAVDDLTGDGPRAVALTGYDNTFVSSLREISLTTVDPDNDAIGRSAARTLANALQGDNGSAEALAPPRLIVRRSSTV